VSVLRQQRSVALHLTVSRLFLIRSRLSEAVYTVHLRHEMRSVVTLAGIDASLFINCIIFMAAPVRMKSVSVFMLSFAFVTTFVCGDTADTRSMALLQLVYWRLDHLQRHVSVAHLIAVSYVMHY